MSINHSFDLQTFKIETMNPNIINLIFSVFTLMVPLVDMNNKRLKLLPKLVFFIISNGSLS